MTHKSTTRTNHCLFDFVVNSCHIWTTSCCATCRPVSSVRIKKTNDGKQHDCPADRAFLRVQLNSANITKQSSISSGFFFFFRFLLDAHIYFYRCWFRDKFEIEADQTFGGFTLLYYRISCQLDWVQNRSVHPRSFNCTGKSHRKIR